MLSLKRRAVCFIKHAELSGSDAPLLCSCWGPALLSMLALSDPASKALFSLPLSFSLFLAVVEIYSLPALMLLLLLLLLLPPPPPFQTTKIVLELPSGSILTSLYEWDKETRIPWDRHHQSVYTWHGIILFCPSKAHRCHPLQDLLFFVYCDEHILDSIHGIRLITNSDLLSLQLCHKTFLIPESLGEKNSLHREDTACEWLGLGNRMVFPYNWRGQSYWGN